MKWVSVMKCICYEVPVVHIYVYIIYISIYICILCVCVSVCVCVCVCVHTLTHTHVSLKDLRVAPFADPLVSSLFVFFFFSFQWYPNFFSFQRASFRNPILFLSFLFFFLFSLTLRLSSARESVREGCCPLHGSTERERERERASEREGVREGKREGGRDKIKH